MRSIAGNPPEESQNGLKANLIQQNYFLACRCIPQQNMEICYTDSQLFRKPATIIDRTLLSNSVLRLRTTRPDDFPYFAGQYTTIFKHQDLGRTYSIASVPHLDSYLEYHIKLLPNGKISQWLHSEISTGTCIAISEALGNSVYVKGEENRPIALIATGTGLSPMYGVLRDAISSSHQGEIRLYHGVNTKEELYLDQQLCELAETIENFHYIPCLSNRICEPGLYHGYANQIAVNEIGNFSGWRVYLAGNPDMVKSSQKQIFLAGASLKEIHIDPFAYS